MNLNAKVHPGIVALVMVLTFAAIAFKMWADGKAIDLSGPAQMLRAPTGEVYIQVQDQLLEHDAAGEFVRRIDLSEMGVDAVIGELAFFPNGDLLLRRGRDARGFFDGLRAYARLENTADIRSPARDTGLARCSLSTRSCEPFGNPTIDFKATFSVYVDAENQVVYVSDTSRHLLRSFSFTGDELAIPRKGLRFPNQLVVHEGMLLVADTNHHRVALLDSVNDALTGEFVEIDVIPPEAVSRQERWPSHFAMVGERWWVNNMRTDMRNGGIYVFDREFQFEARIPLPGGSDPIAILPFGDGALISDWDNARVHYVSSAGEPLGDFTSSGLDPMLAETLELRRYYGALSWLGIALLVLILAALFIKAAILPGEAKSRRDKEGAEPAITPPDKWVWFQPRPGAVRKLRLSVWMASAALAGLIFLLIVVTVTEDSCPVPLVFLPMVAGLAGVTLLVAWMSRANTRTAVGLRGDELILRDHRGRESRSPLRHVRYSETTIATRDMAVVLGRPQMPLYDKDEIQSGLLPFLERARKISEAQMQILLVQLRHPNGVMLVLALLVFVAVLIKYVIDKIA